MLHIFSFVITPIDIKYGVVPGMSFSPDMNIDYRATFL